MLHQPAVLGLEMKESLKLEHAEQDNHRFLVESKRSTGFSGIVL
jgi:hypothetical protein